jgi:Cof subfamily protein (haloacid dehalogenase superfamily)
MASRWKMLALDIDGTIVDSRHKLRDATRTALQSAKAAGIEVVLATGRRYSRTLPLVAPLGIAVPLITASGALIKNPDGHQTLFCAQFEGDSLRQTTRAVAAAGYEPVLYADTFHLGYDYYLQTADVTCPLLKQFLDYNPDCHRLQSDLVDSPPRDAFAGFAIGTEPQMRELASHLDALLPGQLYVHVLRSPRYDGHLCEIAPAGVSKWTGVLQLARERGIRAEEICAVGDDVNDLPMITGAGFGIAMENAVPELKAAADRIAPANDDDGVAEVVKWLLEA